MTSSSMAGMILPPAIASSIQASVGTAPKLGTSDPSSPAGETSGSNENSSSALDQAMAATLASIEIPATTKEAKEGNSLLE